MSDEKLLAKLIRDLARHLSHVRPSALGPRSDDNGDWYEELREIEDRAKLIVDDDA